MKVLHPVCDQAFPEDKALRLIHTENMKSSLLTSLFLLMLSQIAVAEEITGFNNFKFGDPLANYLQDTSYSCSIDKKSKFGDYKCTNINPITETIAGHKLNWLELQFAWDTKKLRLIYMTYLDSNDYPDVLDYSSFVPKETHLIKQALTEIYGNSEKHCGIKGCTDYIWRQGRSIGDPYIHLNAFEVRFTLNRFSEDGRLSDKDRKRQDEYVSTIKRKAAGELK